MIKTTLYAFHGKTFTAPVHSFPENSYRAATFVKLSADFYAGNFDPREYTRKADCDRLHAQLNPELAQMFSGLSAGHQLSRKFLKDVLDFMRENIDTYKTELERQKSGAASLTRAA